MRIVKNIVLGLVAVAVLLVACVYLAPGPTTRFFVGVERMRSGLERKEFVLPDGVRMVYLEGGQGEPLMLLHGFSDDKDNFVYVARELVGRYHVIIPDINGFGESSRPNGASYGTAAQVARLNALAHGLGLDRLHLGGSSMGGQISLVYALTYPEQVKSLWLLDAGGLRNVPPSDTDLKQAKARERAAAGGSAKDKFDAEADLAMSDPPFIPKPMMDYIGQERAKNEATEKLVARDLAQEPGLEGRIGGMATPTLIVWGEQDHMINPAAAGIFHRLLPRSQVVVMAGAGHLPMLEKPEQSAADYVKFRTGLAAQQR
jgi:pimeloyl-ACP methyl ester carboxylesterase